MDSSVEHRIAQEFRSCVVNTIERIKSADTHRPFHTALLSDEALFWSRFERSFSTSFGQRVIEEISKIVVLANGARDSVRQKETEIAIDASIDDAITEHESKLRAGKRMNWEETLQSINAVQPIGVNAYQKVISDLWWIKNGINHYVSIKTVKPNIDQTAVAKRDLLRLKLNDPRCKVFFGLYYNPYGEEKTTYNHAPPMGVFDFRHDSVVLIGREYWDTLGGDGTYDVVLDIARSVGSETKEMLEALRGRR
ncbi:MAG: TdeIII family type II restriction endonuclease [Coriobacteriales bacterium]|jgi:hypothetical protein|nr:TdeIII family type II restriction endonuclease [Coriobacteriales bacterium]